MKVLLGVPFTGHTKDYVLGKFLEMADACIRPIPYVDILWTTDRQESYFPQDTVVFTPNFAYCEDVVMIGRDQQVRYAEENGYDKLVWQGIDCLYQSKDDFERLINYDYDCVGALTTARSNSNHAVAAQFYRDDNGWQEGHYNFEDDILNSGNIIPAGIPGSDAAVFNKNSLDLCWHGKHDPWYVREARGTPVITCEAWYFLEMQRRGQTVWLDTSIKTWHVHEDLIARMWKGIEKPLNELSW